VRASQPRHRQPESGTRSLRIALLLAPSLVGQNLVDPQRSVFMAFPEADAYQIITRDVDVAARRRIEDLLPFRLHFNELRSHSLYVALRGRQPLGLVYARREESAFGLTDLTWAMSLDLRVVSCRFERVRTAHPTSRQDLAFARRLAGHDRATLLALLDNDGKLRPDVPDVADRDLAAVVVRSALKAIAIADTVWPADLQRLRDVALALRAFPICTQTQRLWPPPDAATKPSAAHRPVVSHAVRAFDRTHAAIGIVAEVRCPGHDGVTLLSWALDPSGTVRDVAIASGRVEPTMRTAMSEAAGAQLRELAQRPDELGAIAKVLLESLANALPQKP